MSAFTISDGFAAGERRRAAQLYWQAFGGKLGKVLGPLRLVFGFSSATRMQCSILDRRNAAN